MNESLINAMQSGDTEEGLFSQYVTFIIASELYGVDVLKVQEIIGMTDINFIPNSKNYMKGMINLRGKVVPVVDMRLRFKIEEKEYDEITVIIIVEVAGKSIGMIVDSVSDVLDIATQDIQQTPHFSSKIDSDYIQSIGKKEDKLIIILDVDRVLTAEDIASIQ